MDNTSNVNQEKGSITKIAVPTISQTEYSDPAGSSEGSGTVDAGVDEGSQGRGDFTQTSQQKSGAHQLPEGR